MSAEGVTDQHTDPFLTRDEKQVCTHALQQQEWQCRVGGLMLFGLGITSAAADVRHLH